MLIKKFIMHCFGYNEKGKCVAVYYHLASDNQIENFIRQMNLLKKMAKPIRAGYTGKLEDEKLYVIVTFDDGFQNILVQATDELLKLRIPCVIFIPTHYINKHPDWDDNINSESCLGTILTKDQIKSLPGELFTIGSHSHSHKLLTHIPTEEAEMEFSRSKEILEEITGRQITLFSFPYGEFNNKLVDIALKCGYKRLFSIQSEVNHSFLNNYVIGRFYVESSDSLIEFKLKIVGAYKWMNTVSKIKRKFKTEKKMTSEKNKQPSEFSY